jgi:hypothetical protein
MERGKKLKNLIFLLIGLFVLDLVILGLMIPRFTLLTWAVIFMQAVVAAYFTAIALGLIRELRETEDKLDRLGEESRGKIVANTHKTEK